MNAPNKRLPAHLAVLLVIVCLSILLRINNWSNFLIYPDSYRYLLEAKNQLLILDKPLFVYLIKIVAWIVGNLEFAAHLVVYSFSLATVPLLYFTAKKHFGIRIALISSFFLGISFSHSVWTGYIMPDVLAIFFYFLSVFFLLEIPLFCGFFLFLSVLIRPEYILLFIPTAFFYLSKRKGKEIFKLLPSLFVSILLVVLSKPALATIFSLKSGSAEFIRNFLSGDFLIVALGIGGIFHLYKKQRNWFWYFFISFVLLVLIYQITSPSNWRYGTHLLIGLSVPAGFWVDEVLKNFNKKAVSRMIAVLILPVALIQIFFSNQGIKSRHPKLSYETISASTIKDRVQLPELPIVTYYSEAYAWHLDKESLTFDKASCKKEVVLIEDQPTRDFSAEELQKFKTNHDLTELKSFWVNQGFFYRNKVYLEKAPVVLYLAIRKDGEKTDCNNSGL